MKTQSHDTSESAEKVLISLMQKASFSEKFSQITSLSQTVMLLSRRAIARANSDLSEQQINLLFVAYNYGEELALKFKEYLDRNSNHEDS